MNAFAILLPVIFPIIAGACLLPVKFSDRKARQRVVLPIIVLNAIFALYAIFFADSGAITIFRFSNRLSLALHVDGLSKIFGTMVSLLWIPTTIYAFEYMTHEGHEDRFFSFFTMTFGVVIGIAFADNFLTMYLFYEFLTLVTLPIVMHQFDNKARHAGKTYVLYMMFGASLAFIGFVFVLFYGTTTDFVYGGVLNPDLIAGNEQMLRLVFVLAFFGFGVKAAVFPFYRWLPKASVAPTPVTALLHAVAVVKSGVFAIIRLTYYAFGTEFLIGTWAQYVMLIAASITIVFGSTVALRTPHIKRRFAYSTISNLSYIIFGVAIMTPTGLAAGMLHMIYHAVIKITLFFTAGAIYINPQRISLRGGGLRQADADYLCNNGNYGDWSGWRAALCRLSQQMGIGNCGNRKRQPGYLYRRGCADSVCTADGIVYLLHHHSGIFPTGEGIPCRLLRSCIRSE